MEDIADNLKTKEKKINYLWDNKENITIDNEIAKLISEIMDMLSKGIIRVAYKEDDKWHTHEWLKKAILLFFRVCPTKLFKAGYSNLDSDSYWYDKIESKFDNWKLEDFQNSDFRAVPGCLVRKSAYIAPKAVLMPSFVNVGAYIGENSMIDTWSTIGSCAQIGKNCHISGGVGIGGVLEPIQATPVIIEDNCFIGARSEVAEGVIIGEGSVLAMGVYIGASTKIIDRFTGHITYGYVPPYSVVIPGSVDTGGGLSTYCVIIVKKVDEKTRSKTSINELLRI